MDKVMVCSFQACPTVNSRTSYRDVKRSALKAGRFSTFEATENKYAARMYTRLWNDPTIETFLLQFPWTGVKKRMKKNPPEPVDWKVKAVLACSVCNGCGCGACNMTGKMYKQVARKEVDSVLVHPEKAEFACVGCHKKEAILRPIPNQIPHGWLNWGGELICSECKSIVVLAAVIAANQRVQQLKDDKGNPFPIPSRL